MKYILPILFLLLTLQTKAQNGGACIFILPDDNTVVCYTTGNAGNPSINNCLNTAANLGALPIDCLSLPLVGCASWYTTNGNYCFFGGTGTCAGDDPCELVFLPIELINFSGVNIGNENIITWSTASENNSDYYSLRIFGPDTSTYETYNLPAAGHSQEISNYRFIHAYPSLEYNYYQLVQYDFNGDYKEYSIIAIDNRRNKPKLLYRVNLLGQQVNEFEKGFVVNIYSDGSTTKEYK